MSQPQPAFAEMSEFYRADAAIKLDPRRRSDLGQFMTPTPIARFMASLFEDVSADIHLLDPGAGVGSLTAAFVERISLEPRKPRAVTLTAYEIEPVLITYLHNTLGEAKEQCRNAQINAHTELWTEDFILDPKWVVQPDIFHPVRDMENGFTHVLMNPPYKKIHSSSIHRLALRNAGIETSNLYTAFLFLAAKRLRPGGELVAIVPRSFCNGLYFKPFREQFFAFMCLRRIHIFETRHHAFRSDNVLQENIILHAIKGVSRVYESNLPGQWIGFENHLNVFHTRQRGLSPALAYGLSLYLNSSLVDRYFRQFNGHTQVNAADLRSLNYPARMVLERLGSKAWNATLSQQMIDYMIETELSHMTNKKTHCLPSKILMMRKQSWKHSACHVDNSTSVRPSHCWH